MSIRIERSERGIAGFRVDGRAGDVAALLVDLVGVIWEYRFEALLLVVVMAIAFFWEGIQ